MAGWAKSPPHLLIIFVLSFFIYPLSCPAASKNTNTSVWEPLIEHLIRDGQDEQTIRGIFARREVQFNPSVMPRKLSGEGIGEALQAARAELLRRRGERDGLRRRAEAARTLKEAFDRARDEAY
ncbi:MAG: hypothetical protein R6T90_10780, partial [Dissulfuribacterales bacterium]